MSNLVVTTLSVPTLLENAEQNGKQLYKQNENYRTLANCLEHPEFRKFLKINFSNWAKVKTIVMFMKLYEEIEKSSPV